MTNVDDGQLELDFDWYDELEDLKWDASSEEGDDNTEEGDK